MEFFSGSKPNLISNNTLNEINNLIGGNDLPVKEVKINNGVSNFYKNYIEHNLFFIALAILFLLFLYWRYETKNSEEFILKEKPKKKKEKKDKVNEKIIDDLIDSLETNTEENNFVAHFNPAVPVNAQQSYTNYMDDHVPVLINGNKVSRRQFYNDTEPEYNYLPHIENNINRADTYTGLFNNYNNYQDQNYPNPYGWEQNFNQTTYDAMEFATQKNRDSLAMLNQMTDNANNEIIKNIM